MLIRYLALVISFALHTALAQAGEFNVSVVGATLEWKPTRCSKPSKPVFHVTDVDSYNAAVKEYNQYLLQVRTYRSCVNEEAQQDAKTAAQAISNGLDQANDGIQRELESAMSKLESAKRSLP